ncbi:MAG: 50S ribosomal protein L29 [Campylobacterota bacterium]
MKYTEIADKSLEDLTKLLKEKKLELFTLRAKLKTMQLQDSSEIRKTRKDIAKIRTALTAASKAN